MKRISGSTALLACGVVMRFALAVCQTSSLVAQTTETKTRFVLDCCARADKSDDATAFTDCFAVRILHATMADETVHA
jgi:hypothetical protein